MKFVQITLLNIIFIATALSSSVIKVTNEVEGTHHNLKVLSGVPAVYSSIKDLANALSLTIYENVEREKIVLYVEEHRIKISAGTSFIIIDEIVYQIPTPAIHYEGDIYLPSKAFFNILEQQVLPNVLFDSESLQLSIGPANYNVQNVIIEEKINGTILHIKTNKRFKKKDISAFTHKNGWFYVTIKGGVADQRSILNTETKGLVKRISTDQLEGDLQLSFLLRSDIDRHEVYNDKNAKEIVITLWAPLSNNIAKLQEVKTRWEIDTIVLDAGHGGKDPGTSGKRGTKEKTIVLDIVKRLGKLLTTKTNVKVVYTREEDVFIPLWKRTKIANENEGKIFISVHANGNKRSSANGFETYLLRPGKTQDAIDVAAKENSAIKYEESRNGKYEQLTSEGQILATMAQSTFMKESESLAALIQKEMGKKLTSPNRGVKQAGFYVLIGASMPNVLVEVGFLTNPDEEKKLRSGDYRQQIADAIYRAVVDFKKNREFLLSEG